MEEQNIDMEKVEELFERVPQVFRKTAVDFANNIISNQNLNEEEKKEALQNLIKKVTSVVAYVATIERNLKNIREGFNDYLAKPIDKNELKRILETYLKDNNG